MLRYESSRGSIIAWRQSTTTVAPAGTAEPRKRFYVLARSRTFTFNLRPAVAGGSGTTVSVPAGSLTLTGYAPTVTATANISVSVPAGALTLTGGAPTVATTANVEIAVPAGALTLTALAPTVTGTFVTPEARNTGAGSNRKRHKRIRYVAEYRGEDYEFDTYEALEAFVESKRKAEQKKPRKERKAVRIELAPQYVEEVSEYVAPPKLTYTTPPLVALEQIKKLEERMRRIQEDEEEDDEVLLWLM